MTTDQAESVMRADSGAFDPEILEIFLRKARSVLGGS
jgi:response regulator RpfG family c-di-GMP phosphodiesterase